jgi:hypothetical protein
MFLKIDLMITSSKLKIYKYYKGDIDNWARAGTKLEKSIMKDEDWAIIESFLQDLALIKKNLTSSEFTNNVRVRLKENCENDNVIQQLKELVE